MLNFANVMTHVMTHCFANITRKAIAVVFLFIVFAPLSVGANKKFTLVIDAGHGGRDIGAPGTYSNEKDINLRVALAFGRYVEQSCEDVCVVYTRKTDIFIPLYERAAIANKVKADLFVSIHTNAVKGSNTPRGFETYTLGDGRSHATKTNLDVAKRENSVILLEKDYQQHYAGFDPNSPESNIMFEFMQDRNLTQSIDFAKMLQKNVCKMANRPNKGVHQQNLAVLRLTSMPACLIELGFITTPDEERLLNDAMQTDLITRGIFNAFAEYKNKYDKGIVVPFKTGVTPKEEAPASRADGEEKETAVGANRRGAPTEKQNTPDTLARARLGDSRLLNEARPVFKVQVLVTSKPLRDGDAAFKGITGCEAYEEGGLTKYTCGASNNYNEINRLRSQLAEKFPGAFVIAFKNGKKMDVKEAIREFKRNRNK